MHINVSRREMRVWLLRILALFRMPVFWVFTIAVNTLLVIGAFVFFAAEHGHNPKVQDGISALYWSVATITTVGYGDIVPVTVLGRLLSIVFMLLGSLFTVIYTTIFVAALIAPELKHIEKEMLHVEKQLDEPLRSPEHGRRKLN